MANEVVNNTPCSCGLIYPWTGPADQVRAQRRRLGNKCPACFTGRQSPAKGEQPRASRGAAGATAPASRFFRGVGEGVA